MSKDEIDALLVRLEAPTQQYERQLAKAEAAMRRLEKQLGTAATNAKLKGSKAFQDYAAAVETSTRRMNTAMSGMSANARNQIQNAGYSVNDFIIQVEGGTDPLRAFSQQSAQLFQGLGLIGVGIGIAAAALPMLINLFSEGGEKAKTAEEAIKAAADAVAAYSDAAELALEPMDQLIAKYGAMADEVQRARIQQALLAKDKAVVAGRDAAASLSTQVGQISVLDLLSFEGLTEYAAELKAGLEAQFRADPLNFDVDAAAASLQDIESRAAFAGAAVAGIAAEMGITNDQAQAVAVALAVVRDVTADATSSSQEQVAAAQGLVTALVAAHGSIEAADRATNGLVTQMLAVVTAAAGIAATDIASGIGAGANEAERLAGAMARAASYQSLLSKTGAISGPDAAIRLLRGGTNFTPEASGAGLPFVPPRGGGRGGGGGGGGGARSEADRQLQTDLRMIEQLFDSAKTAAEKYADAEAAVYRAREAGKITSDEAVAALDLLRKKFDENADAAKGLGWVQKELKAAILDFADGGAGAMDNLAKAIKRAALEALLFGSGPLGDIAKGFFGGGGLFGGDGGGGTGGMGLPDPFGGGIGKRAMSAAKFPSIGGIAAVPKAAAVGRGGGGGAVEIHVRVEPGAVADIAANTAKAAIRQYDGQLPRRVRQIQSDPRRLT